MGPSRMGNRGSAGGSVRDGEPAKKEKKSFFSFLHVPRLGGVRGLIAGSAFGTDPLDLELT